jgi:hypothetical protein
MKKIILITLSALLTIILCLALFIYAGVIWRSPPRYIPAKQYSFQKPIMSMQEYFALPEDHRRPYIFTIKNGQGSLTVLGITHTKNSKDPQVDSIQRYWSTAKPTVALVEGRLGFLFQGLQDPIEQHGEGGELVRLAKKNGIAYYSWEPERETEIQEMSKKFHPMHLGAFYSLRPYFSNFRFGKPSDPDATLQNYIDERTSIPGLQGTITSVAQIDSIWKKDLQGEKDWRETSDEYGWPKGYLSDIFNASNLYRDHHLCSIIMELVEKGEKVIVTMGSSHAYRIRQTLEYELK